jgi:hypothetical protein
MSMAENMQSFASASWRSGGKRQRRIEMAKIENRER